MTPLLILLALAAIVVGLWYFRARPPAAPTVKRESEAESPEGLPADLEPFRETLEATSLPYVKMTARPAEGTLPWQSKIRGAPYLPRDDEYPAGRDGQPLVLLAQINFAEVPELPGYPTQGILQFFIPANDDLYGLCLDGGLDARLQGGSFHVRYFPLVDEDPSGLTTDFAFLEQSEQEFLPASEECELRFSLREEMVPTIDYRFGKLLGDEFFEQFGDREEELAEAYWKVTDPGGHKIGGYAYFTQADPRESSGEDWLLLFQMDTDSDAGIMWGDMGVGGFFIREDDLKNRRFSGLLYNWDCC